jgi:hypothetical protein
VARALLEQEDLDRDGVDAWYRPHVSVRTERDPSGMGGRAWYVESPAGMHELPPTAVALVAPHLTKLFRGYPASIAELARRAPLESMRRWLTSLTDARCVLEVYATALYGREARLRFHFDRLWAPSFRGTSGTPRRRVPRILEQVHAITGHVDYQYGCSGTLVAVDALQTLDELVAAEAVMNFAELADIIEARPELGEYVGVYESNGDYLCVGPDGRTAWVGGEGIADVAVETGVDLTAVLDAYFEALLARRRLNISGSSGSSARLAV